MLKVTINLYLLIHKILKIVNVIITVFLHRRVRCGLELEEKFNFYLFLKTFICYYYSNQSDWGSAVRY
jgi:hypothetical protein